MNAESELPESEYFEITAVAGSIDAKVLRAVINVGIDSRLEGFTLSKFNVKTDEFTTRLYCHFHTSELSILIRRLCEFAEKTTNKDQSYAADALAYSIVYVYYGQETI